MSHLDQSHRIKLVRAPYAYYLAAFVVHDSLCEIVRLGLSIPQSGLGLVYTTALSGLVSACL